MELRNFIGSAYLKMLDFILFQKTVSGFCADTPKHFAHLFYIHYIRIFPKDQFICLITL